MKILLLTGETLSLFLILNIVTSCAFQNRNAGELQADIFLQKKEYEQALAIIQPAAKKGFPWAQLRLAIAYEYGQGVKQDYPQALKWYKKTADHREENGWSDGHSAGFLGENGFYKQNKDAQVAQFLMARIFYTGAPGIKPDINKASDWMSTLLKFSEGNDIIYCCENSSRLDKQIIKRERIEKLSKDIQSALANAQ